MNANRSLQNEGDYTRDSYIHPNTPRLYSTGNEKMQGKIEVKSSIEEKYF